ncbi:arylamine N-acetyltransferase family protein [Actinoalloteichus caeruleus]|uniref:N-hydroxyarylamine O-acetyltransferase n=1 Tax=Actinoalloteichus caeruleus DSM 43889 TaxID=1120930 RepID=A0ABT1JMD8_ACTCY|nr:arylamine N-acetyltransferase [Actinoalloteichus caeruleus]MCP2333695.1 N-hydroxyarylamine O-acetyltransferase [Actinoalloteichus caeruleus DSM 43889]
MTTTEQDSTTTLAHDPLVGPELDTAPETARGWASADLDLDAYLARIGYDGDRAPNADTLRAVHRAHATTVPFENLGLLSGGGVRLDTASLQDKLVRRRRGGYCFEQNVLLAAALERLGYRVSGVSTRIRLGSRNVRPAAHAALLVEAEERMWLADVSVGEQGVLEPTPLVSGAEVRQGAGWRHRLAREEDGTWALQLARGEDWQDLYGFTLEPHYRVDYVVQNHFAATHPTSPFRRTLFGSRGGEETAHSLSGLDLTVSRPDSPDEVVVLGPDELPGYFRDVLDVPLTSEEADELVVIGERARADRETSG